MSDTQAASVPYVSKLEQINERTDLDDDHGFLLAYLKLAKSQRDEMDKALDVAIEALKQNCFCTEVEGGAIADCDYCETLVKIEEMIKR